MGMGSTDIYLLIKSSSDLGIGTVYLILKLLAHKIHLKVFADFGQKISLAGD